MQSRPVIVETSFLDEEVPDRRRRAMLDAWCELLESERGGRLVVKGESMVPSLRPGWGVGVRPLLPARLEIGDVAVFLQGSRLVAHRIVVNLGWGHRRVLFERGDCSLRIRRLGPETVVGRVEEVQDEMGRPVPRDVWRWTRRRRAAVCLGVLLRLLFRRVRTLLAEST